MKQTITMKNDEKPILRDADLVLMQKNGHQWMQIPLKKIGMGGIGISTKISTKEQSARCLVAPQKSPALGMSPFPDLKSRNS